MVYRRFRLEGIAMADVEQHITKTAFKAFPHLSSLQIKLDSPIQHDREETPGSLIRIGAEIWFVIGSNHGLDEVAKKVLTAWPVGIEYRITPISKGG